MSDAPTQSDLDGDDPVAPTKRFGAEEPVATTRHGSGDAVPVNPTQRTSDAEPRPTAPGPESSQRRSGSTVGTRYRLERRLNAGGMGEVYLAQALNANQKVVVKFPHVHLLDSPEFLARFDQEVNAMLNLTHRHIVEVYDAGKDRVVENGWEREQPYLVVRYMSGGSLLKRIEETENGRLDCSSEHFSWLRPIAQALDFVHAQGVVHRDVKPDNLLFDDFGNPYLSDFGIAKVTHGGVDLTLEGTLGSIEYMAPEYDSRATSQFDQYSLAVIVYKALCGQLPHSGERMELLANKVKRAPEPLSRKARHLPPALVQAVMRGLAREPHARFPSCTAFADAVLAAIRGAEARRRRLRRWMQAALVGVPLAALVAYVALRPPAEIADTGAVEKLLQQRLAAIGSRERATRGELEGLASRAQAISADLPELDSRLQEREREAEGIARESVDSTDPRTLKLVEDVLVRVRAVDEALERIASARRGASELRQRALSLQRPLEELRREAAAPAQALRDQADQLFELGIEVARLKGGGSTELKGAIAELEGRGSDDEESRISLQRELDRLDRAVAGLLSRSEQIEDGLSKRRSQLDTQRSRLDQRRAVLVKPEDRPPITPPDQATQGKNPAIAQAARKLVMIDGGPFFFGCDENASDACDPPGSMQDEPAFAIDRSEVSVAEYAECVGAEGCTKPQGVSKDCNWSKEGRADHPVNCVDFDQARVYCRWVGKELPTERQWEKAARGPNGAPFPWGSEPPSCERAVYADCSKTTAPVESKPLNASGVRNMAGNVWEWTKTPDGEDRVIVRGGSFRNNATGLRADRRSSVGKTSNPDGAGFRCARSP